MDLTPRRHTPKRWIAMLTHEVVACTTCATSISLVPQLQQPHGRRGIVAWIGVCTNKHEGCMETMTTRQGLAEQAKTICGKVAWATIQGSGPGVVERTGSSLADSVQNNSICAARSPWSRRLDGSPHGPNLVSQQARPWEPPPLPPLLFLRLGSRTGSLPAMLDQDR